jgi:hypothetical protein
MNQGLFFKLEEYAREVAFPLRRGLKEIEKVISQLNGVKEQLTQLYEE